MTWRALVLAGSRGAGDPVAAAAGVALKALAPVAGRAMIGHVLDALAAVPEVGAVSVAPGEGLDLPGGVGALPAAATPAATVLAALERLGTPLLVTTADNPLMAPETVRAFLAGARSAGADIAAGVAERAVVERAGNPARRTYLRFSDMEVSGCNLFAVVTEAGIGAVGFWRRQERHRKRPWRMAWEIGPLTLIRYRFGRLDTGAALRALGRRVGCRAALVPLDDPFAAHDVDKPEDLAFAERILRERGG